MNEVEDERRRFHRIVTDKPVHLTVDTRAFAGTVVDISLHGLLVTCAGDRRPMPGDTVQARVVLDDDSCCIECAGEIVHTEGDRVGLRCTAMDIDSAARLRRLVELNLADPAVLERELTELLAD